jgi:hypothetical protein
VAESGEAKSRARSGSSGSSSTVLNVNRERFASALGNAVLECWGQLPQDTQHMLFEKAVLCGHDGERDESLRPQLAEYLHDHHPRTDHDRPD